MNDLQIFTNEEFGQVRTITEGDKTLFCGSDVAKALGYTNTKKAVSDHCNEDGVTFRSLIDSLGREQQAKFIDEGNVYRLIVSSKLPAAVKFEKWLFETVVPTIRKHGIYMTDQRLQEMLMRPDTIINIAVAFKNIARFVSNPAGGWRGHAGELSSAREVRRERSELCHFRRNDKVRKIPEREFVTFLLDNGFLYRSPKGSLMLYKKHAEGGLFELKECANERTGWFGVQLLITPKGRETFRLLCGNTEGVDDASAIQTK